ncbi:aldo/keto reductase [Tsukamurella sp. 8F]|uniref:aldo/keto reductase n=1 Tax=unclassified Tsukamurella TaxID=2633480 RepID=UPI0023B9E779|nr:MULTISPECIES: aldo/keto reductase [unclassified Tsukamurella]MDF0529325.1 aldo/keto reductase [Tsukamurella sp. 8J]MDF0587168.1 aldo/keto reductase [Tsukamurella sp. 8F]
MNPQVTRPGGVGRLGAQTVSRIGYGAMQLARLAEDPDAARAVVRRAVELGVDHIDTAHFYGSGFVNGILGTTLTADDDVVVVTKVGAERDPDGGPIPLRLAQRPEQLRASVEANLRSLGREQLPVVNLRRADVGPGLRAAGDQVVDLDDQLAEMVSLRDEGLIGAIGLSAVSLEAVQRALPAGIVCVQNAYSLVSRGDEALLQLCGQEGIAWVPFYPLGGAWPGLPKVVDEPAVVRVAQRLDRTPAQIGQAWLLAHAPHALLIPGTAAVEHLEANLAVGDVVLDAEAMTELGTVPSREGNITLA